MVHVFIEAQDTHYVWPAGGTPVQLDLSARFRAVVKNLQKTQRREEGQKGKLGALMQRFCKHALIFLALKLSNQESVILRRVRGT